jgi:hypothetical protein
LSGNGSAKLKPAPRRILILRTNVSRVELERLAVVGERIVEVAEIAVGVRAVHDGAEAARIDS